MSPHRGKGGGQDLESGPAALARGTRMPGTNGPTEACGRAQQQQPSTAESTPATGLTAAPRTPQTKRNETERPTISWELLDTKPLALIPPRERAPQRPGVECVASIHRGSAGEGTAAGARHRLHPQGLGALFFCRHPSNRCATSTEGGGGVLELCSRVFDAFLISPFGLENF